MPRTSTITATGPAPAASSYLRFSSPQQAESKLKSERVGRAWGEKKRNAATDKAPITRRCPAWLAVEDGRFVVDEEKADAVRRLFRLAVEGHGIRAIVKQLNAEGSPSIG